MGPAYEMFAAEVGEPHAVAARQRIAAVHHYAELLDEERPGIEALPFLTQRAGDRQLHVALFELLHDLVRRSAKELRLDARKGPGQGADMSRKGLDRDASRQRDIERRMFSLAVRLRQGLGHLRTFEALAEGRQHAPPEIGQLGQRPLAPEQVAAEFGFEVLHRAGQRRLADVAFLGRPGEVARARHRQEIPDLVHLHACVLSLQPSPLSPAAIPCRNQY